CDLWTSRRCDHLAYSSLAARVQSLCQTGTSSQLFPKTFVGEEEEGIVFLDRPSEGCPEVVAYKYWDAPLLSRCVQSSCRGGIKEIACGDSAIPKIFKRGAVEIGRAALAHHSHLRAHGHSIFGADSRSD